MIGKIAPGMRYFWKRLLVLALAAAPYCTVAAQELQSLHRVDGSWRKYPRSIELDGDNLEVATNELISLVARSGVRIPDKANRALFQRIARDMVGYSSVDVVDAEGNRLLLYNSLADVFLLVEFEAERLKTIDFASGGNIASALAIPEEKGSLLTLLTRRPDELGLLKRALINRNVSAIFKKQAFDADERTILVNNMMGYAKRLAFALNDPCVDFARELFFQERDKILLDSQISQDVKDSYKFFMRLEADDGTVYVFGDTLVNRARTFLTMKNTKTQCKTESQLTVYFVN